MSDSAKIENEFGQEELGNEQNSDLSNKIKFPDGSSVKKFPSQKDAPTSSSKKPKTLSLSQPKMKGCPQSGPTPSKTGPVQGTPTGLRRMRQMKNKLARIGLPTRKFGTPTADTRPPILIKKLEESPVEVAANVCSEVKESSLFSKPLFSRDESFGRRIHADDDHCPTPVPLFASKPLLNSKLEFSGAKQLQKNIDQSLDHRSHDPSRCSIAKEVPLSPKASVKSMSSSQFGSLNNAEQPSPPYVDSKENSENIGNLDLRSCKMVKGDSSAISSKAEQSITQNRAKNPLPGNYKLDTSLNSDSSTRNSTFIGMKGKEEVFAENINSSQTECLKSSGLEIQTRSLSSNNTIASAKSSAYHDNDAQQDTAKKEESNTFIKKNSHIDKTPGQIRNHSSALSFSDILRLRKKRSDNSHEYFSNATNQTKQRPEQEKSCLAKQVTAKQEKQMCQASNKIPENNGLNRLMNQEGIEIFDGLRQNCSDNPFGNPCHTLAGSKRVAIIEPEPLHQANDTSIDTFLNLRGDSNLKTYRQESSGDLFGNYSPHQANSNEAKQTIAARDESTSQAITDDCNDSAMNNYQNQKKLHLEITNENGSMNSHVPMDPRPLMSKEQPFVLGNSSISNSNNDSFKQLHGIGNTKQSISKSERKHSLALSNTCINKSTTEFRNQKWAFSLDTSHQNSSGNSSGHSSSHTIDETNHDSFKYDGKRLFSNSLCSGNDTTCNDVSLTANQKPIQPGREKKASRSLYPIFESNKIDLCVDGKHCNADSGFQDAGSAESSEPKTGSRETSPTTGTAIKLSSICKGSSDSTVPYALLKSIGSDLANLPDPIRLKLRNEALVIGTPSSSNEDFKKPIAPVLRFQNEQAASQKAVKENITPMVNGIASVAATKGLVTPLPQSRETLKQPANNGDSKNYTPLSKSKDLSEDLGGRANSGDFTPLPMNKELAELIKERKQASANPKGGMLSTTRKHKIIRIKKERYRVVSPLGRGGSSKVYEVENEQEQKFALKCVRLDNLNDFIFESYINEIQILQALSGNPNIIRLHEWEIKNEVLHMLMERGDMDLDKFLRTNRNLEQDQIKDLWRQMLNAVNTIHKRGIIHTDLKPANFLFVDSALKLIDFGIAKGIQEDCTSTQRDCLIGTLNYMAPESVSEVGDEKNNTEEGKKNYKIRRATDIWSLGCILYLIVFGKTPFQHITGNWLKVREITSGKDIYFPDNSNEALIDSIKGCLKRNQRERYTIEQLLAHPFLNDKPREYTHQDDNEVVVKNMTLGVMESMKKSTVDSPHSLQRLKKTLAKKNFAALEEMKVVRKAIF